ncbi:sensor histidine kinase [Lacibacter sediminis]|uniref:Histidine kinase n=1 Tax=Lacibacter sediminis TaxID=2760713 RepID=A0A7G5XIX2_9BACT|nr:histidine kinase [Lacibacter sediminis]QNA45425.1 histidine kinase [Lacibacter sediminis]
MSSSTGFQEFIFSEKRSDRIKQHLLFWAIWYLYLAFTNIAYPIGYEEWAYFKNPLHSISESFFIVFAQAPAVYIMLYFIFPRFILKKKYLVGLVFMILLWLLCFSVNFVVQTKILQPFQAMILPSEYVPQKLRPEGLSFYLALMSTNKAAFTITASALMLKFGKHWYHHQHRSLQLQKENTEAQLQLLTAQVHPHFLFNTLNNIFSKTQTESPGGSKMIMSLSDMLRYILYEGQKTLVPLKQELTMITEYINLEKIRYGNKLDVHMLTPHRVDGIYITPLLLLPFVENCFKHGTSNMLKNPWINLTVEIKDTTLVMKLMNGKTHLHENGQSKAGIGISNVRKRLELLYKEKHDLHIREDEEVFVVDLKVELVRIENKEQVDPVSVLQLPVAHV